MYFKQIFLLVILTISHSMLGTSARVLIKNRILAQEDILTFRLSGTDDMVLGESFIQSLREANASLNCFNHTFFNPRFLKNTLHVQDLISRASGKKEDCGKRWQLTVDGVVIEGTFFDRSSDVIVFITGGFSNAHEYMAPFIKLFPHFDIVLFDLPGHGRRHEQDHNSRLNALVNVDLSQITFGFLESAIIQHVAACFLDKKQYKTVSAVGRCYSVPFFARAAVEWESKNGVPLFDKLVLDSAFVSFQDFVPNFPALYCSGYHAPVMRHFGKSWLIGRLFYALTECILGKSFADFPPIYEYLVQLEHTDLLFVHSRADVAIPMSDFEFLWSKLDHIKNKGVLFTANKHAMSHIKQKEVYGAIAERFIQSSFTDFASFLTNS